MRAVQEVAVALLGDGARVLEAGDDRRGLLLARSADLVAGELRVEHHLAEEVEAGGEVVAQEFRGHDRAVGAGRGADPAAERLDRPGELLGRQLAGAATERVRRHRRHALLACRILGCPRTHDQMELDERQLVVLGDDHVEPVVEDRPRDAREPEVVLRVREPRQNEQQRERLHDTPPGRGGRPLAGRPGAGTGTSTTTVRCVRSRYVRATRWTSSALTARHASSRRKSAR